MRKHERSGALRKELEHRIKNGRCAYCRAAAVPEKPLTREHVIPRARGGRRKDLRIIVPACARCNQRRGCQEVVLFLLARPRRISAFLEYLATLPAEAIQEIDRRIFAELYAALWLLRECASHGRDWRLQAERLCSGRRLHRRRYAARRVILAVEGRLERVRERAAHPEGPSCLLPALAEERAVHRMERSCGDQLATLVSLLSVVWEVSAERVGDELARELRRPDRAAPDAWPAGAGDADEEDEPRVVSLDRWRRRGTRRRRGRVDARRGRGARRGRAA
ncbi:MAG TPA: HNH endonuclease [Longimicrobiaceae bacterium]|nr:HNH endonuclease [Longimicrobiaceae bacterium]